MAIIIGMSTIVSFGGADVASVSWNSNAGTQRLYKLGSNVPVLSQSKPTQSVSVTVYSPGPTYDCAASTTCNDASTISVSVSPGACEGSVEGISGSFYVSGYSYSKEDACMPGQESWSLQAWLAGDCGAPQIIRGISEGSTTDEGVTGITLTGELTTATQGSVSAGSVGKADTLYTGTVVSVGAGDGTGSTLANGSASIPYTPIYLGQ